MLSEVLIAYTAVVLTVIGGLVSFILVHFIPVKARVDQLWNDMYGHNSQDGFVAEREDDAESLREKTEKLSDDHERSYRRINDICRYLHRLSESIAEAEGVEDVPEPDEEIPLRE